MVRKEKKPEKESGDLEINEDSKALQKEESNATLLARAATIMG